MTAPTAAAAESQETVCFRKDLRNFAGKSNSCCRPCKSRATRSRDCAISALSSSIDLLRPDFSPIHDPSLIHSALLEKAPWSSAPSPPYPKPPPHTTPHRLPATPH